MPPPPPRAVHISGHAREARDFYATPAWVTEALLKHVTFRDKVWEPCCGTGAIADWGLRTTGDDTVFLQGLIQRGLLTGGTSPLSVIFDAGSNMTYVIPEIDPNTAHGAVVLLVGALGLLERRLRRSGNAVTLS
jgi:hypothetical protein